jgi:hypothetical protein
MNFKTTYILAGALVVVLAVFLLVVLWPSSTTSTDEHVLVSMHDKANPFKPEDVERVEIEQKRPEGPTLVFERDPSTKDWRITAPRALKADKGNVDSLVEQLYRLRPDKDHKPDSLQKGGLDSPTRIITLQKGDRAVKLTVGDAPLGIAFVTSSDRPKAPLAVRKSDVAAALEGLNYFRSRDLLGDNTSDVQSVTLKEGKYEVKLQKGSEGWRVVESKPSGMKCDADFKPLLTNIADLKVSYTDEKNNDFVADGVTDLSKYHLGPKDTVLRIKVGREADKKASTTVLVVGVGKALEKPADKDKDKDKDRLAEKPAAKYYAYLDEGKSKQGVDVVKVSASAVEPFAKLVKDPGSLRSKNLVQLPGGLPDHGPLGIVVESKNSRDEDVKEELLRPEPKGTWQLYLGGTAHPVDKTAVDVLEGLLTKGAQVVFTDEKRPLGDLKVSVYFSGVEKEGKGDKVALKKGAQPAAVLRFARRPEPDGQWVFVERDWGGDKTWVKAPRSVLTEVEKGPLAYLDRTLPKFSPDAFNPSENVTRLVVTHGGQASEVVREKGDGKWKIVQPASRKGREASAETVREVLEALNRIRALKVVALKATPAELKSTYNLDPAPVRASVTVTAEEGKDKKESASKDKKDKKDTKGTKDTTTEFLFGGAAAEKDSVYAKVSGKDTIYAVSNSTLTTLEKDLQDLTVLAFTPSDVESIKLTGWVRRGKTETLDLERKGEGWTIKGEASSKVKAHRVNTFLNDLHNGEKGLKAERFVSYGTGPQAGQGLDLKQPKALQIEIKLRGQKEPLQLLVGGEEAGKQAYYAVSKQVGQGKDVFTVPKGAFERVREDIEYFEK